MKKRILAAVLATASILGAVTACDSTSTSSTPAPDNSSATEDSKTEDSKTEDSKTEDSKVESSEGGETAAEGKVLNIWTWNEEYKNFFLTYYAGTRPVNQGAIDAAKEKGEAEPEAVYFDKAPGIPEGVEVVWTTNPSDNGVYQHKLDEALAKQDSLADDEKIDIFLAEADYIKKYTASDYTLDVSTIGVNKLDTQYEYTVQAASDNSGVVKGVSFQCCPAAVVYRRSYMKDVIGSDDPAEVQKAISDWSKFDEVAAKAKEKGYLMTGSYAGNYRVYSNNVSSAWVEDGKLVIDSAIDAWTEQAKTYMENGYTKPAGVWDEANTVEMFKDGKAICNFGPAWYYNFCMGNAMDPDKGCYGDWAICQGPQPYFWGGTWLLASASTDNKTLVADIMNAFIANEDICSALVENEMQFVNNSKVNEKFASDPEYGNAFLGGQNDTAVFVELAKGIKFEHKTAYDQLLSEKYPEYMLPYINGESDKETCLNNFKKYVTDTYPEVSVG